MLAVADVTITIKLGTGTFSSGCESAFLKVYFSIDESSQLDRRSLLCLFSRIQQGILVARTH